ncbi:protein-export membrane protein SecF [Geobacter metallireducens RCH3]|uniref:Protein-export membrane protein SecF n=1 Tax=Geobacter metallireducens (strain ATCC 53774 / DSM 7210 / GS-15) TaxID=269799 RepID=Q39XC7_GEOMG|nr:protein translocase subunit SecF [Geobacter metallireducens]ABB31097.1 protein export membrane protein SecF [Geobacter metallireducens GS-15]EHP86877.1 protein-export membrane protein SecF [Geobacter metallireducens RCH3]
MEFIGKTHIDFMGMKKFSFAISIVIAILGIIGIVRIALGTANMGIDFSGGTAVQLKFAQPVHIDRAREALAKHGIHDANLQELKTGNKLLVKVGKTSLPQGNAADLIQTAFQKELTGNTFVVESSTEIGPAIGDKLRKDTLVAVAISMIGILIYIAWRFDFTFGVGALVATLHDVLAMFAVFFLLDKEVNLLFITAVLTIAGYSLTDTVVVFDRIRENLHKNTKDSLETIFNFSINEVLSRTIITALTTFLAAGSLYFFGGEVIHDFALALVVGILVGVYSSVFVASPIVEVWGRRPKASKA